jgi:ketosteroid isomerase-like protein
MLKELPSIVAEYIRAVNAFDTDAIMATFAKDALVNDNHREIVGAADIRRWLDKEIVATT